MELKIEKKIENENTVFVLEGRLNTLTSVDFEKAAEDIKEYENVIIDMEKLEYISSAGLRILLKIQKLVSSKGYLTLVHVNSDIMEIFEITGFASILNIK